MNLLGDQRVMAYRLERFRMTIAPKDCDSFFDPRNADIWIPAFADWLKAEQRKSAEVRASND
jgi:hypothetical protein